MKNTNITICFVLLLYHFNLLAQNADAPIKVSVVPNHPNWICNVGDSINFSVLVSRKGLPLEGVKIRYRVAEETMPPLLKGEIEQTKVPLIIRSKGMEKPGFFRCEVWSTCEGKEYYELATVAVNPEEIKPTTKLPEDFVGFWEAAKKGIANLPLDMQMVLLPEKCTEKVNVYHLSFQNNRSGSRIYGILCMPKAEGKYPAILRVPGAGVRPYGGDIAYAERGFISLQIGIHGIPVNLPPELYRSLAAGALYGYQEFNFDDRDKNYFKRVYLGCTRSIDAIFSLEQFDGKNLFVLGSSQGGALAIVSAGIDSRVSGLVAYCPALCDISGYLNDRAGGWPHVFRNRKNVPSDEIINSYYYDVVNFAKQIKVPGFYSFGYNDKSCPPTSIYSMFNSLTSSKELFIIKELGHKISPEQNKKSLEWILRFLKTSKGGEKASLGSSETAVSVMSSKLEDENSINQNTGLLSISVNVPGETVQYKPRKGAPYKDKDTIYIELPFSKNTPIKLKKLQVFAKIENEGKASPPISKIVNLSKPYTITTKNILGKTTKNYIKVVVKPPKISFKKEWFKTGNDLGYKFPQWISSVAVSGDYLLLYDGVENKKENSVRVFNRLTGKFIKSIKPPVSLVSQLRTDDAGRIVLARRNWWKAGFMLYLYDDINSSPELILNYKNDAGCPPNLGYKFSVTGNLKKGKAYVYAVAGNRFSGVEARTLYFWEFNNGIVRDILPTAVDYTPMIGFWEHATIQRKSIADPDLYVSYLQSPNEDKELQKEGGRFQEFSTQTTDFFELDKRNHKYKILGFKVFELQGRKFLAILEQGFFAYEKTYLKIFDITNRDNLSLIPGSEGHKDFLIFESEGYASKNYAKFGDIAVSVNGDDVCVYATVISDDLNKAGLMMYKLQYDSN